MRRSFLASCMLATLAAGCTPADAPADANAGEAAARISWGTADNNAHPAVVALLTNAGGGAYSACSASIVQQKGGYGYVLTAAHCCIDGAPDVVVVGNNYGNAAYALVNHTTLPAGTYTVDAASVRYHASFSMQNINAGHDFCMLKFATSATLSTLALPASSSDGLAVGTQIEHVGYGNTNYVADNTARNKGTDAISQLDGTLILYQQGGTSSSHISGTCQGDSGGPALTLGTPQIIVGVTSFGGADAQGNPVPCGSNDTGGADRVVAEIGAGKFITSFLADTPTGATPGSAPTCDACASGSQAGACNAQAVACGNDPACITLSQCYGGCTTTACQQACANTAGQTAVNELNAYSDCVCKTACVTACAADCGGASPSCGFSSSDTACNSCIQGSCCAEGGACAADTTCNNCVLSASPPVSCKSNAKYNAFEGCLATKCVGSCVPASSSSSSSGSASSSSSSSSGGTTSSGGTSSSSSSGGGGSGGGAGGGGVTPVSNQGGGCSVGPTPSNPASGAGLGGLLLGLGLLFARRRAS